MSISKRTFILVAALALLLPWASTADSGHDRGKEASHHMGGYSGGDPHGEAKSGGSPASLASAWDALSAARDAIAADLEKGELGEIHEKAEPLPALAAELLERSGDLDAGKRARIAGAVKQISRVADALHEAADGGDLARTRREAKKLAGLLALIRAQVPADALEAEPGHHGADSDTSMNGHGSHAHRTRPRGLVDAVARTTVRVQALDPFRFEPARIVVEAGVPTRIELANAGVVEHSLVVKTPDGSADWVHLHVPAGETAAGTFQLDRPGTYPLRCTIPGHQEGGMVGELVVVAAADQGSLTEAPGFRTGRPIPL